MNGMVIKVSVKRIGYLTACLLFAGFSSIFAAADEPVQPADREPFRAQDLVGEGARLWAADREIVLRLRGRFHYDFTRWVSRDDDVEALIGQRLEHDRAFRRARLGVVGSIDDDIDFVADVEFASGVASLREAHIRFKNVPGVENVYIGHTKVPFGLEQLTGSNNLTFVERSLPDVLTPGRKAGFRVVGAPLELNNPVPRMTWATGLFWETPSDGRSITSGTKEAELSARVTGLPWYAARDKLLHVGLGGTIGRPSEERVRFRSRPEVPRAQRFVDTGNIASDRLARLGAEAALVHGPASIQAEYMTAHVNAINGRNPRVDGYYVMASYFLTGESRNYNTNTGAFGSVRPRRNFRGPEGGWGAWEIAARYSTLDLDSGVARGGKLDNYTLGVNWYLNPNMRVMLNWVHSDLRGSGDVDALVMRLQFAF